MKTKITPLFLITAIFLLGFFTAKLHAWQKEYVYDYQMGDNDSRNNARNAAVEQIKLKAVQEAGTYMQGTTVLQGEDLTETITQIGAAIVKVNVLKDEKIITEGNEFLRVTALVDVDESVIEKRISVLREDKAKDERIKKLTAEKNEAYRELDMLRQERARQGTLDANKLAETLRAEASIQQKIQNNLQATNKVFDLNPLIAEANRKVHEKRQLISEKAQKWDDLLDEIIAAGEYSVDVRVDVSDGGLTYHVTWHLSDSRLKKLFYVTAERDVADTEFRYSHLGRLSDAGYLAKSNLRAEVFLDDKRLSSHPVIEIHDHSVSAYYFEHPGTVHRFRRGRWGDNQEAAGCILTEGSAPKENKGNKEKKLGERMKSAYNSFSARKYYEWSCPLSTLRGSTLSVKLVRQRAVFAYGEPEDRM